MIPHFRDGDRGALVPVPLFDLSERELARIALELTDDDQVLTPERTEDVTVALRAVFDELERRRGWTR